MKSSGKANIVRNKTGHRRRVVSVVCNTPQAFDLIVGTSTGGILAMMIGSLHMTLDECAARWLRGDRDAAGALGARDWGGAWQVLVQVPSRRALLLS